MPEKKVQKSHALLWISLFTLISTSVLLIWNVIAQSYGLGMVAATPEPLAPNMYTALACGIHYIAWYLYVFPSQSQDSAPTPLVVGAAGFVVGLFPSFWLIFTASILCANSWNKCTPSFWKGFTCIALVISTPVILVFSMVHATLEVQLVIAMVCLVLSAVIFFIESRPRELEDSQSCYQGLPKAQARIR